ncbi:MAG: VOC family protein [Dehalococcoidia bacterium]|nr:VOC family protein [Dehalococcoidia bacterium]
MAETVKFYTEILGLPVIKTEDLPDGGQHVVFGVSDRSGLSYYWFPDTPEEESPGLVSAAWGGIDPATGGQRRIGARMSTIGSMNHIAFEIPLEKQEEYIKRLRAAGIDVTEVSHHIFYGKNQELQVLRREDLPPDAENVDEFINSIYFGGPDGVKLEFAAYTRPLGPDDVKHQPARARLVAEEVEVAARRTAEPKARAAGA